MDCGDRIDAPTERESPFGKPVVRGDERITGEHAAEAVRFDPEDPESVELAADIGFALASNDSDEAANIYLLRGAAACAVLVRAEGSYKAAAERVGGPATVPFIRKWARVHDHPRAIRVHVARGDLAPSAAKHIARLDAEDRYCVAWAALDNDLSVREVRSVVGDITGGTDPERALERVGARLGELTLTLSKDRYQEIRRQAALRGTEPEAIVESALEAIEDGGFEPGESDRER